MNHKLLFPVAAMALILAGAGCHKAGKLAEASQAPLPTGPMELKLKWPQGERVVQSMDLTTKSATIVPGQSQAMQQNMIMGQKYALTVLKENPDGSHEVGMEFLGARMWMEMNGKKTVDYNPAKPTPESSTNPVAVMLGKMTGSKIRFFLDASNNVERVGGVDEMMSQLSTAGSSPGLATLKGNYSEDYFKQIMVSARFLPARAVSPGDTWPVHLELPMEPVGTLQLDYAVTLHGWEKHGRRNCARMEFAGTIKTKSGSRTTPIGPMGMTVTIQDGIASGTAWFDPELGIVIDSVMNEDMTMALHLPQNPGAKTGSASQPQTLTSRVNQSVKIKLDSVN